MKIVSSCMEQVFINVPRRYLAFHWMISPFLSQRVRGKFIFASPAKSAETLFKYDSQNLECFLPLDHVISSYLANPCCIFETSFWFSIRRYISPDQVPVQYGGLSVHHRDHNPEFTISSSKYDRKAWDDQANRGNHRTRGLKF